MESANKEGTISKFFGFKKFNTTFKKEIVGGISTLLAMIYILSVEPGILSGAQITAIMAFSSTFVMGMFANIPVALAPSMGVNAMFTFNVANQGVGFEGALICTMISSILFCAISISKFRQTLIKSLPKSMHLAIGIGIGFFIAYVGVANIG
ncbi:hypothetical protein FQR65_LT18629 [Abscondita terminalis]|nr:hypothetical protein FQR65_LT18629 [Abscondita terminalis]